MELTTEQKQTMHDLLDFAIECKEVGFNLWLELVPHIDCVNIYHTHNKTTNGTYKTTYKKLIRFNELTQQKFEEIKHEVLAIINEVDFSEITDKNQNHGC